MKKILFLVSFFAMFVFTNAQTCGTNNPTTTEYNFFMNTIKNTAVVKNAGTTCIPLQVYVFRQDDGSGGVSMLDLNKGLANLNMMYLPAGIEFYYSAFPTYIDNSDLNDFNGQAPDNDVEADLITAAGSVTNAVNIYCVENITLASGFQAAGYAYFPSASASSNRMVMAHDYFAGNPAGTFAHEFGHYFSLFHTFQGTSNGNTDPNAENVPRSGANANCSSHGDGFCDTDADPGYSAVTFNASSCTYTGGAADINGVTYVPTSSINNIMSYYPDACVSMFSAEQYTAIAQGLVARQSFAAYDYTAPPMTVTAPSALTATYGNGVELNWTDNATNEMGYIIERSFVSSTTGFVAVENGGVASNTTSFSDFNDLVPNTTYYYRIKASNGDCNTYSNVVSVLITYCPASGTTCDEILTNVTIGSINNSTTAANCATSSYQNFTALSTDLTVGVAQAISMTVAPTYTGDSVSVWIDWNQDNDFDDTGEKIFTANASSGTASGSITAPVTAVAGSTRMRVRLFYQNGNTPCGTNQYGEVEDYTVNVIAPVASCGSETFTNNNLTASYASSSYVGDNGVTWSYLASRDESTYGITGDGIILRRVADNSKVVSSAVSGGIADFTCSLRKAFTGAGNRQVALYVNGTLKGTSLLWDNTAVQTFTVTGINVSGNVVVEIRNTTPNQVIVDDISWTCYTAPAGVPTITVGSTAMSGFTYVAGSGPSATQTNTLSWADLTANVLSGNVIDFFEFSVDGGTNWYDGTILNVAIPPFPGTSIAPTSVLVRLKTGLAAGTYNDTVILGSTGATSVSVLLSGTVTPGPCSELMISEYVEGTSNNKYIEIYNASNSAVNLSSYDLVIYANGSLTGSTPISLSGSLASGAVYVVRNNSASVWSGTSNLAVSALNFNGNDAVALRKSGQIIDVFGTIGNGSNFAVDVTYTRLSTIQIGNLTFTPAEWTTSAVDNVANLGTHITPCVAVCTISDLSAGVQTSCVPATNTYAQEVTITYSTAPATGTLDVNGQSFAITSSPQTVNLTGLVADGNTVNVTANFSDLTACTYTENALFTAPANCSPVCNITSITAGAQTACVPATNTYTQEVVVTYANAPATGTLDVNGQSFAITSSPQTVNLMGLVADGNIVNVTASFSADAACTLTENALFTATADCTPTAPCSQLFISEYGEPSGGNNKYIEIYNPSSSTVDLSNYRIWYITNGGSWPESSISLSGTLASGDVYVIANTAFVNSNVDLNNNTVAGFNGDDAVGIAWNGGSGTSFTLIDAVGTDGADPGTGWAVAGTNNATADKILKRKSTVQAPNTNWSISAGTNTSDSEWELIAYSGSPAATSMGAHISDCITPTYVWTGVENTDWNYSGNWSGYNVPTVNDVATIPDVSAASGNFPLITLAITLGDVTVEAGASLTVNTGIVLNGTLTNNGSVVLQNGAYLDDFTHSGATYVGNITVETIAANGVSNDQRFIASPVNTPSVSQIGDDLQGPWGAGLPGANGVAVTVDNCALQSLTSSSNYGNLFELNETIMNTCAVDGWVVKSSGTLQNARGYSAYLPAGSTFDFSGTPNTGTININATNSGSGIANGEGWNLFGNPYPSPINRNAVITAGATDVQYYETSGVYQGTFSPYLPGQNIAIAQGFQAHVNTNTTLTFDNTFRNTNAATWYQNENWFTHLLTISVLGTNAADKTIVYFNEEATNGYEPMYDVVKRSSKVGQPTLASVSQSDELALNGKSVDNLGENIPLHFYPGTNGSFSINVEGMETFPTNTTIYIKDNLLNMVHNVANGNYTFTANTADLVNRFELIFIPEVSFSSTPVNCENQDGVISLSSTIGIENRTVAIVNENNETIVNTDLASFETALAEGNYTITVTDIYGGNQIYNIEVTSLEKVTADFTVSTQDAFVGEIVSFENTSSQATQWIWTINNASLNNLPVATYTFEQAGDYVISLLAENNDCSDQKEMTIHVSNKTTGIDNTTVTNVSIYPNPVKDILYIDAKEMVKVEIYNVLGSKIVSTNAKEINMKNLSKGVYMVHVFDADGQAIKLAKVIKN